MTILQILALIISSGFTFVSVYAGSLFLSDLLDEVLFRYFRPHIERCLQLRMSKDRVNSLLRWWSVGLTTGTAVLGFVAHAWPLAVTWAILCGGLPVIVMQSLIHRRENILETQLVSASRGLSNAVKAGLPVHQGLASVAAETPVPLRGVLEQIVYQFEHGRPLSETLREARRRLSLDPFTLFSLAIEVSLERGGRVNQSLDRLAGSLQEWHRIKRKLESETASGRFSVLLLSLAPLGFCLLFWLAGTDSVLLFFTNPVGQCVFSVIAMLIWSGNRWTSRIMRQQLN